jgi:hypothetical protein
MAGSDFAPDTTLSAAPQVRLSIWLSLPPRSQCSISRASRVTYRLRLAEELIVEAPDDGNRDEERGDAG